MVITASHLKILSMRLLRISIFSCIITVFIIPKKLTEICNITIHVQILPVIPKILLYFHLFFKYGIHAFPELLYLSYVYSMAVVSLVFLMTDIFKELRLMVCRMSCIQDLSVF